MSNGYLDPSLYTEQDVKPPGLEAYQHAPLAQGVQQMAPMQHQAQTAQMNSSPVPGMPPDAAMPPQSDVDEFLKKKRKAREHKACYPCRQRKVKYAETIRDEKGPRIANAFVADAIFRGHARRAETENIRSYVRIIHLISDRTWTPLHLKCHPFRGPTTCMGKLVQAQVMLCWAVANLTCSVVSSAVLRTPSLS